MEVLNSKLGVFGMVGVPHRASVGAGGPAGAEGKDTQRNAAHSTHFAA